MRPTDKQFAFAAAVSRAGLRFVLGMLVARAAGPVAYGTYFLLVSVEAAILSLAHAAWITPYTCRAAGAPGGRGHLMLGTTACQVGLASALLGVGSWSVLLVGGSASVVSWGWLGIAAAGGLLGGLARAERQSRFASAHILTAECLGFGVPILAVLSSSSSGEELVAFAWQWAALGQWCSLLVISGGMACLARRRPRRLRDLTAPMTAGSLAVSAGTRAQAAVLETAAAVGAAGLFGAASTLSGPIRLLSVSLSAIARPRLALARNSGRSGRSTVVRACSAVSIAGLLALIVSVGPGERWISMLLGPKFPPLGAVWGVMILYASVEAVAGILVVASQSIGRSGAVVATRHRVLSSVVALIILWPACQACGALGAAGTLLIAETLFALLILRSVCQQSDVLGSEPSRKCEASRP